MIKVALVGYGQMGRKIEELAGNYSVEIVSTIDKNDNAKYKSLNIDSLCEADLCIDFSLPTSIKQNLEFYIKNGITAVIGTTGWYDEIDEVKDKIEKSNGTLIYGSNFSVGMNVFFKIIENTSKLINKLDDYDIFGHEFHHKKKADSPSGTAKELANIIIENVARKTILQENTSHKKILPEQLHFTSTRVGAIPGTHTIGFDADEDSIELTHRARSRAGFAKGALLAAIWVNDKKGFFSFKDVFNEVIDL